MIDVKWESMPPVAVMFTPIVSRIVQGVDVVLHDFGNVCKACGQSDLHATITSGAEGRHPGGKSPSQHYHNAAVDFRVREWPKEKRPDIMTAARAVLGIGYSLLLESDHLHVERKGGGDR